MSSIAFAELSANGVSPVRLECVPDNPQPYGDARLYFLEAGITGWYSTPDLKVSSMERGNGDGAHDVPESIIDYASRTIQLHVGAVGENRMDTVAQWDRLRRFVHRMTRLRVVDAGRDAYCEGMFQLEGPAEWAEDYMEGVFTLVCNRPEILAAQPQTGQLLPVDTAGRGQGGLSYNQKLLSTHWLGEPNNSVSVLKYPDLSGTKGIRYPLTYAGPRTSLQSNQLVLENHGTSRAYPVFTCNGPMPNGVDLVVEGTGLWLKCSQPVYGEPLVLDSRSRTASVGGLDVSRTLEQRGFPVIEPGGSITVTLRTAGTGFVNALVRDTWM